MAFVCVRASLSAFLFLVAGSLYAASMELQPGEGRLGIVIDGQPFATYVFRYAKIPRPYFCDVHAPGGAQVTRNHPPIPGKDATDHDLLHPGIWLAFGDLGGVDFWRNKGRVEHEAFTVAPKVDGGIVSFAVCNRYLNGDHVICSEECKYWITVVPQGRLLRLESVFTAGDSGLYFGDQEEMGLGLRMATPIAVKNGGTMTNSDGLVNEKGVWGKQADWCDYWGIVDGQAVGMMLMPDPLNFRRSWFHARDYGFVAANPFGVHAFTKGEKSMVVVKPHATLRLGFGVLVHGADAGSMLDRAAVYRDYVKLTKSSED